jgi:hypothetical protein
LLGAAAAIVISGARWNGPGIEAAMPVTMGSPSDVAPIVIVTKDVTAISTWVTMRFEKCLVMSRALITELGQ